MFASLYRKVVPQKVREVVYKAFLGDVLSFFRDYKEIFKGRSCYLYYSIVTPRTEKQQALKFWGKNAPTSYPYLWKSEYEEPNNRIEAYNENGLPYVLHKGKRLYFKRDMNHNVANAYRGLLIEQDIRSAHRYVNEYEDLKGKILLDIGAAEAIFTLDTIEFIEHAYLFECEEGWIEALNATFAPWKDKITIVQKYVSDIDDEYNLTLDSYFKDKPRENLFLKMDIEGYERKALKGGSSLLKNASGLSGAVCIYHLNDDEKVMQAILSQNNLATSIVRGFLYYGKELRHAIMRFER